MAVSENRKATMARYNEQNKKRILFQSAQYRDELRLEMIEAYGGKCNHCGEDHPACLVLDHINNDPEPEYAVCGTSSRGGYALYRRLRQEGWPKDRLQLLCHNCNMKKEHRRRREEMEARLGPAPEIGPTISRKEARAKAGPNSNNSSGFKGVLWDRSRNKWMARTVIDGRIKFFGRFDDIRDAAKCYNAEMSQIYGETFVPLTEEQINFIADAIPKTVQVAASPEELGL